MDPPPSRGSARDGLSAQQAKASWAFFFWHHCRVRPQALATAKPLSNMAMLSLPDRMDVKVAVHGFRSSFRDWPRRAPTFPLSGPTSRRAHRGLLRNLFLMNNRHNKFVQIFFQLVAAPGPVGGVFARDACIAQAEQHIRFD